MKATPLKSDLPQRAKKRRALRQRPQIMVPQRTKPADLVALVRELAEQVAEIREILGLEEEQ